MSGMGGTRDAEGWILDDDGRQYGFCNSCGEESPADTECCEDGEIWPYDVEVPEP